MLVPGSRLNCLNLLCYLTPCLSGACFSPLLCHSIYLFYNSALCYGNRCSRSRITGIRNIMSSRSQIKSVLLCIMGTKIVHASRCNISEQYIAWNVKQRSVQMSRMLSDEQRGPIVTNHAIVFQILPNRDFFAWQPCTRYHQVPPL